MGKCEKMWQRPGEGGSVHRCGGKVVRQKLTRAHKETITNAYRKLLQLIRLYVFDR